MKIKSIQVGRPQPITYAGKSITTAIFKSPISGAIQLNKLSLEGDEQADLTVHGGEDKALYAYPYDTYDWWRSARPQDKFDYGALGENLCVESLPEDQIFIGDTFELGTAIVQVTQPRFPCYKLAAKFQDPKILKQFMELNRPGIYFRVLKEGSIKVGDQLKLTDQENVLVSVQELFELKQSSPTTARLQEILKLKSLNNDWRERIESYLR